MAASLHNQHVVKLRRFLVVSYMILAAGAMFAGFLLSWYGLPGAPWFLGTAIAFGLWASVTTTCHRISANDVLGLAKAVGQKSNSVLDDAK